MPSSTELSNLEVRCLVEELRRLEGCYFEKIQDLEEGFKLKFTAHELVVNPPHRLYLTSYTYRGKTPSNFSMYVRKRLRGRKVKRVGQADFDRVIFIEFDEGYKLIFELFAKGNMVLIKEGKTLRAIRNESWKDREIRPGKEYKFPSSQGLNPLEMTEQDFHTIFNQKDVIRSLVKNINMSGKYLEEACYRAGVNKLKEKPTKEEEKELFKAIKQLIRERNPGIQGEPVTTRLESIPEKFVKKESFNQALDEYFSQKEMKNEESTLLKLQHRLKEQEKRLEELERRKKEYKQIGDLIYVHFHELENLFKEIWGMKEKGMSWSEIEKRLGGKVKINPKTMKVKVSKL